MGAYVTVLDCQMRYVRSGTGPTVVLLHTLRMQLEYFAPLVDALGSGLDIVVPDLPGHGRSAAPPVEYTQAYFTDAVAGFLDVLDLNDAVIVGESIGGSIALALAARPHPRVTRVVALNPYDYGRGGGIRRSSLLANVLFALTLWPVVGPVVLKAGTKGILRRILEGGVHDAHHLPPELVDELWICGSLPGHERAFLSLCRQWRTWIDARSAYDRVGLPVTLVYGEHDWSSRADREANRSAIRTATSLSLDACGHFSSLERPKDIARIVRDARAFPTTSTGRAR